MTRRETVFSSLLLLVLTFVAVLPSRAHAETLEAALVRLASAPTIEEVQAAALRSAALDPAVERALLRRLRSAALLPRLEVSLDRGMSRDEDLDRAWNEPDDLSLATDSDLGYRFTVRWDLDRLIYDPEELRARREVAYQAQRRRELLTLVTRLYYQRLEIRARLALSSEGEGRSLEDQVRVAELTALLDGLTGGELRW